MRLEVSHAGLTTILEVKESRHSGVELTMTDTQTTLQTTTELSQVEALSLARILEEQVKENRRK
jgi:hypothetical protein